MNLKETTNETLTKGSKMTTKKKSERYTPCGICGKKIDKEGGFYKINNSETVKINGLTTPNLHAYCNDYFDWDLSKEK